MNRNREPKRRIVCHADAGGGATEGARTLPLGLPITFRNEMPEKSDAKGDHTLGHRRNGRGER